MEAGARTQHEVKVDVLERVKERALRGIRPNRLRETNLAVDRRVRQPGETLGPALQRLVAERASVLVFADDEPRANFAHPCRYLLFDPESAEQHGELAARFPPWGATVPSTLEAFHTPVQGVRVDGPFPVKPVYPCLPFRPIGRRYAIFFAGMSNTRHLNDMEFGYRTLVHRYLFDPADIAVLSFDGTRNTQEGANAIWPGDGTPYQIHVNGPGTGAALEAAFDAVKRKLREQDLLFVHTNNHGDWDGAQSQSYLCEHPSWGAYYASQLCAKLAELPRYRSLIVMMEQCNAGGFNAPIIAASTAEATSVASAAIASQSSYVSADGHWDPFARDWFSAQAGHDPHGAALVFNPDGNANGQVEALEAFAYADTVKIPLDSPQFSESSAAGGQIALGQRYVVFWWWCLRLRDVLGPQWDRLSQAEYTALLHELEPELRKLTDELDERSGELERETVAKLEQLVRG